MVKSAKRHEDDEFELVEEEEEDDVVGGGGGGAKNSNSNSNSSSSLVKCPVRVDGKTGQRNTAHRSKHSQTEQRRRSKINERHASFFFHDLFLSFNLLTPKYLHSIVIPFPPWTILESILKFRSLIGPFT